MKHIKLISLAVCAALVFMLSGCTLNSPATVMNVDGTDIPSGLYLIYQLQAYNAAASEVTDTTNVLSGEIDGQSAADWIHAETVKYLKQYVYIAKQFDAEGLELSEEDLATLQSTVDSGYEQNEDWFSANGVGKDTYYNYCLSATKENALYEKYAEENEPTESQIRAYMDENYSHVHILYLPSTDSSLAALDEATLAQVNDIAEDAVKALDDGTDFDTAAEDAVKAACELTGRTYEEDSLSGYVNETFIKSDTTAYSEEAVKQLFDAKVDSAFVVEGAVQPTVMYKVENFATDEDYANYEEGISLEMTYADFEKELEAAAEPLAVTEDASAVKAYSPSKIKE